MNARQRRRHTRAVRLMSPAATRRYVTFVIARRHRLECRGRRYHPGSRAELRNHALRKALAQHPDVGVWKVSQWMAGPYAGSVEGIAQMLSLQTSGPIPEALNNATPLLFPDVTLAEIKAVAERWKTSGLNGPWYSDASKRPNLVPLTPNWWQTGTGRSSPPASPPGPSTFPAGVENRLDDLGVGLVGRMEPITGRFSWARREPPMRNIPFPRIISNPHSVIVGTDAEDNLVVEPSTLAADIRAAATVSVDVPDRSAIDAEEIPQAARADVYAHIDFVPDFVPVPEKE